MKVECKLRSGGDMPTPPLYYVCDCEIGNGHRSGKFALQSELILRFQGFQAQSRCGLKSLLWRDRIRIVRKPPYKPRTFLSNSVFCH